MLAALPPNPKCQQVLNQDYNSYGNDNIFDGQSNTYNMNVDDNMDLDDLDFSSKNNDYHSVISESENINKTNQIFEIKKTLKNKNNSSAVNSSNNLVNLDLKEKIKIPFLKKFNPKSIKREEIDKKIIRKFKKYLKENSKSKKFNNFFMSSVFWRDFTSKNLLPPMTYKQNEEVIEYKSFNSNFIVWLFSQQEAKNLYYYFVEEKKDELFESLKQMIKVTFNEDIIIELTNIFEYVQNFGDIYNFNASEIYSTNTGMDNTKTQNLQEKHYFEDEEKPNLDLEKNTEINMIVDTFKSNTNAGFFEERDIGDSCCFQNIDFFKR